MLVGRLVWDGAVVERGGLMLCVCLEASIHAGELVSGSWRRDGACWRGCCQIYKKYLAGSLSRVLLYHTLRMSGATIFSIALKVSKHSSLTG